MPISLKHAFVSGKADGTDSTLIQPSNWNDEHVLQCASARLVGRTSAGAGAAEEITVGAGLTFAAQALSANVTSVAGKTGAVTLAVADVSGAAPLASPTFTGTVTGANATFSGTWNATGNSTVGGTLGVTGALSGSSASFTGALSGNTVADASGTLRARVLGTSQAATSGTSRDFTSIPSWVNRITLLLDSVSTNGSSIPIVQLGTSSGVETSGYVGANGGNAVSAGAGGATPTSGHGLALAGGSTSVFTGTVTITRISDNKWIITNITTYSSGSAMAYGASVKTLGAALDRIRLTTVNGTDTFDAGSVNILYE